MEVTCRIESLKRMPAGKAWMATLECGHEVRIDHVFEEGSLDVSDKHCYKCDAFLKERPAWAIDKAPGSGANPIIEPPSKVQLHFRHTATEPTACHKSGTPLPWTTVREHVSCPDCIVELSR